MNRQVKNVAISWLKSAPVVAWVPKNPGSRNQSIATPLKTLPSSVKGHSLNEKPDQLVCGLGFPHDWHMTTGGLRLHTLNNSRLLQFYDRAKSRLGQPLHRVAAFVTTTVLRIHKNMDRERRGPSRTGTILVQESILNDQPPSRGQRYEGLFDQIVVHLERLIVKNVRHQDHIVWSPELISIEITRTQCDS